MKKKRIKYIYLHKKFVSENECSINDRNLKFIYFEKFKNNEFETPTFLNKYGIWLIGYDGSIKDYSINKKIFLRLFKLIDSMPMRKNEMINEQC